MTWHLRARSVLPTPRHQHCMARRKAHWLLNPDVVWPCGIIFPRRLMVGLCWGSFTLVIARQSLRSCKCVCCLITIQELLRKKWFKESHSLIEKVFAANQQAGAGQTELSFKSLHFLSQGQRSLNDRWCLYSSSDLAIKALYFHAFFSYVQPSQFALPIFMVLWALANANCQAYFWRIQS